MRSEHVSLHVSVANAPSSNILGIQHVMFCPKYSKSLDKFLTSKHGSYRHLRHSAENLLDQLKSSGLFGF
jgi:hypothetical protein